jgi:hypothetical protein
LTRQMLWQDLIPKEGATCIHGTRQKLDHKPQYRRAQNEQNHQSWVSSIQPPLLRKKT